MGHWGTLSHLDQRDIFKTALHVEVNISKTCFIVLQIDGTSHQPSALAAMCHQLPAFTYIYLQTYVGLPIGHPKFIKDFLPELRVKAKSEFQKLFKCYSCSVIKPTLTLHGFYQTRTPKG